MNNRLEIIGDALVKLAKKIEKNEETSLKVKEGVKPSVFLAIGTDRENGKTLFFDSYDRQNIGFYDYVEAIVHALNTSCAQTDDNGELTEAARALLEALINFIVMWYIDNPENEQRFENCLQFYLNQQEEEK